MSSLIQVNKPKRVKAANNYCVTTITADAKKKNTQEISWFSNFNEAEKFYKDKLREMNN